jgi:myo-inositol-1(or 4)-monophosphatase
MENVVLPNFGTYDASVRFAVSVAEEAGRLALAHFGFAVFATWKEDHTPLTIADNAINDMVIRRIRHKYPTHSIYGEEASYIQPWSEFLWVCDPIDGTMAFSCGIPTFVFSLALVDHYTGESLVGVVYDPVMGTLYTAAKGYGAFRNGTKLTVSDHTTFTHTYGCYASSWRSLGYVSSQFMDKMWAMYCSLMKFPSFIFWAVHVANGSYDAAVFFHPSAHDVAAVALITLEAGGLVTDLCGEKRRYDRDGLGCVISNGLLHEELLGHIAASRGEDCSH